MIETIANLMVAIVIALWLGMVAIFSIQNITAVSLKFLLWQSIQLPVGILLAFCVGGGLILGTLLPVLVPKPRLKRKKR